MNDPRRHVFTLPKRNRPSDVALPEYWYPQIQRYWEHASGRRTTDPIYGIRALVIHATAGSSSAGAISVIKQGSASFHWLVPAENEPQHGKLVWACIPEARAAWHVRNSASSPAVNEGATRANQWSLGVEITNAQDEEDPFSDWQLQITAQIARYCWAKYPNLRWIVAHAVLDPTRRSDPGTLFKWQEFRAHVLDGQLPLPPEYQQATPAARVKKDR